MKWILFIVAIFLTLPSYSATLSQSQIHFILSGNTCCYSQEVIDSVQVPTYEYPPSVVLDLPSLKEPASPLTWTVFYGLQVLDVYTTERALQYSCVEEINPILGKSPDVKDIIGLKILLLAPSLMIYPYTITDGDLAGANYLMTAVVANNIDVWHEVKIRQDCRKIR
tara:strand:- start:480 stop:980 length:501 start_codon:yes stop_codon:yes gene_type:complete